MVHLMVRETLKMALSGFFSSFLFLLHSFECFSLIFLCISLLNKFYSLSCNILNNGDEMANEIILNFTFSTYFVSELPRRLCGKELPAKQEMQV